MRQCQCLPVWLDMFTWFEITCAVNAQQIFKPVWKRKGITKMIGDTAAMGCKMRYTV